jgi:2-oxoglutarate ferredoxin oxidoreductase subunit beta
VTKATPFGSADYPLSPLLVALGADTTFIARSIDVEAKHLQDVIKRASEHKGAAFVEILQNCNVYNDGAFAELTEKETKTDTQLVVEHGKPMIFGKNKDRGIRLNGLSPEVVTLGNGVGVSDLLVHDEKDPVIAFILSRMGPPTFPTPVGIVRAVERPAFDDLMNRQIHDAVAKGGEGDLDALFRRGDVWTVP